MYSGIFLRLLRYDLTLLLDLPCVLCYAVGLDLCAVLIGVLCFDVGLDACAIFDEFVSLLTCLTAQMAEWYRASVS